MAICGVKINSEHEDECCVLVELITQEAINISQELESTFLNYSQTKGVLSKGARPDHFALGKIPIIASKGVVDVAALISYWKSKINQ